MWRFVFLFAVVVALPGCSSIFGGSSSTPGMAYIGDLSNNRVARPGETVAYAKTSDGSATIAYLFKGVDSKGGIHINRMLRPTHPEGKRTGLSGLLHNKSNKSTQLVFLPEQTMLVSPGVHVVFIRSAPGELHYRVVMTAG